MNATQPLTTNKSLYNIEITITLEAPYLVHANDPGRFGLDATLITDYRRRPVLPGTLIAGRISEVWNNYGSALDILDPVVWFGNGGVHAMQKGRARLRVEDLVLETVDGQIFDPVAPRFEYDVSRIRMDDDSGAVERGALLIVEQISNARAQLCFKGIWQTWAQNSEVLCLCAQLQAALLLQTQIGAYRGVGFGRVRSTKVRAGEAPRNKLGLAPGVECQRFALTSNAALCVGARSRRGNVFESADVVTGGTVRGVLAQMLMARHSHFDPSVHRGSKEGPPVTMIFHNSNYDLAAIEGSKLAQHFEALRCTHALPALTGGARPMPLPQSLVWHEDKIKDAWMHAVPPANLTTAPAFQTDWKGEAFKQATSHQHWGQIERHLRVRTDIDGEGKAKKGGLFAYECVAAPLNNALQPATEWLFDIDLAAVPCVDRPAVWSELEALLGQGLAPLGKTDARAEVRPVQAGSPATGSVWTSRPPNEFKQGSHVPMLLLTDALLFPTGAVADQEKVNLLGSYRRAFDELLNGLQLSGALILSHFFATQRLAGGDYFFRRYLQTKGRPYQPLILTEAGSVFVFEVLDEGKAQAVFQRWEICSLALPASVIDAHGGTWLDHPYIPNNGYGEVAVEPAHGFELL